MSTVLHSISRDPPAQRSVPGHIPPPPSSTASAETLQLRGQSQVTALLHRPPQHQPRPSSSEVSPRSQPSSTVLHSISRDPPAQRLVPGHIPPRQHQPRPSSSEVSPRSHPSSTILHSISRDPPAQRSVPGHIPPPPSSTASAETLQLRGQSQVTALLHSISRDPPAQRSVPGHIPPPQHQPRPSSSEVSLRSQSRDPRQHRNQWQRTFQSDSSVHSVSSYRSHLSPTV